jgi:hypothetical protein
MLDSPALPPDSPPFVLHPEEPITAAVMDAQLKGMELRLRTMLKPNWVAIMSLLSVLCVVVGAFYALTVTPLQTVLTSHSMQLGVMQADIVRLQVTVEQIDKKLGPR